LTLLRTNWTVSQETVPLLAGTGAIRRSAATAEPDIPEGLIYVHDSEPGIRRRRVGRGFRYLSPDGGAVSDKAELSRIRGLVIPPAWTDVWICADPRGYLQATGRDVKNRKQYLYHQEFRDAREGEKFDRLLAFGRYLPRIREAVDRDMALPGLPREKVLATIVHLLQSTMIRVGNPDYARKNGSFGLTTLRNGHVTVGESVLRFDFKGKSGRLWRLQVSDRRVARIIRTCQELPGQSLFKYTDDQGNSRAVASSDVNAYLASIIGSRAAWPITAKDFRTWAGTVMMLEALSQAPAPRSATQGKRQVAAALKQVGKRLGNTVAVCRRCYVHPLVMESYLAGKLQPRLHRSGKSRLSPEERATLLLLRQAREICSRQGSA